LATAKQFAHKDLGKALTEIRATVYDELHRSFFITRQMDRQFRGRVTDGLLVPILLLLVRSGHTIQGFRFVQIDGSPREPGRRNRHPACAAARSPAAPRSRTLR
jgi:hypothetical protein